jgi:haloalkane dehalogenase
MKKHSRKSQFENPKWLDPSAYPFASHHFETEAGRLHYVDEGGAKYDSAPTVLMLHGNPTWSFLYRHLIRHLTPDYRCIAPDYLGFGLSDKPAGWSYHPREHARTVEALVEALDLRDLTLVVHDWGGPIGLSCAARHPKRVRRLVIMNTWMWPVAEDWIARVFSRTLASRPAQLAIRRFGLFERVLLPFALGTTDDDLLRHYRKPLAHPAQREGVAAFPAAITGATGWLRSLWRRRERIARTPVLVLWGMLDPVFRRSALRRWQRLFDDARVKRLPRAGHFVPEALGPGLGPRVARFLAAT